MEGRKSLCGILVSPEFAIRMVCAVQQLACLVYREKAAESNIITLPFCCVRTGVHGMKLLLPMLA